MYTYVHISQCLYIHTSHVVQFMSTVYTYVYTNACMYVCYIQMHVCTYVIYKCMYVCMLFTVQFEWSSSGTVCVSRLTVSSVQFFEALDLCMAQNIPVNEDMADRMTVDKVEKGLNRHTCTYIL